MNVAESRWSAHIHREGSISTDLVSWYCSRHPICVLWNLCNLSVQLGICTNEQHRPKLDLGGIKTRQIDDNNVLSIRKVVACHQQMLPIGGIFDIFLSENIMLHLFLNVNNMKCKPVGCHFLTNKQALVSVKTVPGFLNVIISLCTCVLCLVVAPFSSSVLRNN